MKQAAQQEEEEDEDEEDGDEEDDGDDEMVCYLEDPPSLKERRLLTRRMFPSKVGGKPAWLVPEHFPSGDLVCQHCSRPLRFLLQVYASREKEKASAFHRVIHMFVCTNCNPNRVRVFRAQLPRANPYYSQDPPDGEAIARKLAKAGDRDAELAKFCCESCGLPRALGGDDAQEGSDCAECARLQRIGETPAVFQERELSTVEAELPEEEDGEAEAEAAARRPAKAGKGPGEEDVEEVFTPGALQAAGKDHDPLAGADAALASAKAKGASKEVLEKLSAYREKVAENSENAIDSSEQDAFDELSKERGEHDPVFSKYNRYSRENPSHVLRYAWGGEPLWFCRSNQLSGGPPRCERCGAERIFEFQVQAQLISLLGASRLADRLDYGIICCYVCSANCEAADTGAPYMEEFAHVQPEPYDAWLPKG